MATVIVDQAALTAAYTRLGSVHRAAAELGISHSVAHRRLTAWGLMKPKNILSFGDRAIIRAYYEQTPASGFDLAALAKSLSRTKPFVARAAGQMGLTDQSRVASDGAREATLIGSAGKWDQRPHPRGFAGGAHGEEARAKISAKSLSAWQQAKETGTGLMSPERLQAVSDRMSALAASRPAENAYSRTKSGFRDDIGIFVRSAWEANYARYLNWLQARGEIERWEYEPETFWFEKIKRGVRSYKPDFRIYESGSTYYVEVKGWMDPKSATKLRRMAKYHPGTEVRLVDEAQYKAIARAVSRLIPNWESPSSQRRAA